MLFKNPVCSKISEKEKRRNPLETFKKYRKKSGKVEKGAGKTSWRKKLGDTSALVLQFLLEALDAFKMK